MSSRLIEIVLPAGRQEDLSQLLSEEELPGAWVEELADEWVRARLLVPTDRTEKVSDLLHQRFESDEGYRQLLFAVEATLPRLEGAEEESGEEEEDGEDEEESGTARISREELYEDVSGGAQLTPVYLATVVLSTLVAAIGLLRGEVAVVIGAMVIAPLLGPNVALALATTLGDVDLGRRALRTGGVALGVAVLLSLAVGFFASVDPQVAEIDSRTRADPGDVVLALAAGSAGALAFTSGLPAAVIGVMVAVALLPPAVAAGMLLGAGHLGLAFGAMVLLVTNVICVNLAGVLTFLAQRVRPRSWWEEERARKATRVAVALWVAALLGLLAVIVWLW